MDSILKFFQSDFRLIKNVDSECALKMYHLPCLISDDSDFLPCDNVSKILQCFQAISESKSGMSHLHDEVIHVHSVKSYSEVFYMVDCKAELLNEYGIIIESMQFQCCIMKNFDSYKIVVLHFDKYELPQTISNKLNKQSELQKISSRKMPKDMKEFLGDVA